MLILGFTNIVYSQLWFTHIEKNIKTNSLTLTYLFNHTQRYGAIELATESSDTKKINSYACIYVDWESFRIFHNAWCNKMHLQ